jgi:hypothetical protein
VKQFLGIFSFLFGFRSEELEQNGVTVPLNGELKAKKGDNMLLELQQLVFGGKKIERSQK